VITTPLAAGVIDVHAHWLPAELFELPPGSPYGSMHNRDGELFLGDIPLSISAQAMSDVTAIRDDMAAAGIGVRVLSAPPFAFAVGGGNSIEYVDSFNRALAAVVADSAGGLVGFGMVSLEDPEACRRQLAELAKSPGVAGVAIPPVLAGASLDRGALREVVYAAADLQLAVLIHPMQLPRPEWSEHYLANLIGNPTETATAVAAVLLGGIIDELPLLRVCFVHGGGCAPGLLGRWEHGWHSRADVRKDSKRSPASGFKELFFDTVTHDGDELTVLADRAGDRHIVCGSDYPFDMAQQDPVRFAVQGGISAAALAANARNFLGI
jgi:aminocarboxymuconate-semialdehyde decarboxylase